MANYRVGDIIRMTRLASGLSQEELSFGICSVETLSRIENGKHKVKKETYERLMARMERNPGKSYAVCVGDDMELLDERTLLEDALMKYDYKKADEYLKLLKKKVSDHRMNQQFIMNTEATLDYYNGKISAEERIKRTEEAIRLTVPDYETYLDQVYPFTEQELLMLMRLANAYGKGKKQEKSIRIYQMILRCLDYGYMDGEYIINFRMIVMRNYANALACLDQFEETLELLENIYELAIKYQYGNMVPVVLDDIAWTKMQIYKEGNYSINLNDIKKIKRQAYYIAAARKDNKVKDTINKYFEKDFKEKISKF